MNIFLKYLVKNIMEKKLRTIVVLLSIAVSSGLFFATESMSTTAKHNLEERVRKLAGSSDITIRPIEDATMPQYLDLSKIEKYKNDFEYSIGVLEGKALYAPSVESMTYIDIVGIDYNDLSRFNPLSIAKQDNLSLFQGNKIAISNYTAEKYALDIGSIMEVEMAGQKVEFIVAAICYQNGLFVNETTGIVAVVPKSTLSKLFSTQGEVNKLYLKLVEPAKTTEMVTMLRKEYIEAEVAESVSQTALERAASAATSPFRLVSILVMFMSVFIVYTAFNVIFLERRPVIGAFRSIGATKNRMNALLILESLILGVIGGVLGCIVGVVALNLMAYIYLPSLTNSMSIQVRFTAPQTIITILFAILLSIGSSLVPIYKNACLPIKDIIFGSVSKQLNRRRIVIVIATILFMASIIIPRLLPTNFISFILSNIALSAILICLLILVPPLIRILVKLLTKVKGFQNETIIGIKNIEGSSSLLNNIKLISISLAGLLFIMSIAISISKNIENIYQQQFSYDIRMTYRYADANFTKELLSVEGVDKVSSVFEAAHIDIVNIPYHVNTVYGIENKEFLKFHNMQMMEDSLEAVEELNQGRYVIVTQLLKSKLGLAKGDKIILNIKDIKREYEVTGFVDTSFSKGDIVIVSADNLKADAGLMYYSNTYVTAKGNVDTVYNRIKGKFLRDILLIRTLGEIEAINKAPLESTFDIIISYSLLAVLIGIVGIINNLIISLIERKRYFAIYRSIGMSKKSMGRMLISEAVFIGVFGAVFGVIGAVSMISIMPYMLSFIYGEIKEIYSVSTFVIMIGATIGIMMLIALAPIRKTTKMSIIETIKYE